MESKNWRPSWVPNIKRNFRRHGWLPFSQGNTRDVGLYSYKKKERSVTITFKRNTDTPPEIRVCFMPTFQGFAWNQRDGFMRAIDKEGMGVIVDSESWFTALEKLIKDP